MAKIPVMQASRKRDKELLLELIFMQELGVLPTRSKITERMRGKVATKNQLTDSLVRLEKQGQLTRYQYWIQLVDSDLVFKPIKGDIVFKKRRNSNALALIDKLVYVKPFDDPENLVEIGTLYNFTESSRVIFESTECHPLDHKTLSTEEALRAALRFIHVDPTKTLNDRHQLRN